jgi:hypothetical protein
MKGPYVNDLYAYKHVLPAVEMIKRDDDDRIIQRLLQANDVQSALKMDQTQWRALKVN